MWASREGEHSYLIRSVRAGVVHAPPMGAVDSHNVYTWTPCRDAILKSSAPIGALAAAGTRTLMTARMGQQQI